MENPAVLDPNVLSAKGNLMRTTLNKELKPGGNPDYNEQSFMGKEPEEVDINFDTEEGYDFEERMRQEPINPKSFLPEETHKYIIKKYFILYSKIYNSIKRIPNSIGISLAISYLFMLGSNFMVVLFGFIIDHLNADNLFLFSQSSSKIFFPERQRDEDHHLYPDRLELREILEKDDLEILEQLKTRDPTVLKTILNYQSKDSFETDLKEFLSELLKNNPLSENFESFLVNGVVTGRPPRSALHYILFKHNFKANRSTTEGNPIDKLLQEISGPSDQVGADPLFIENISFSLNQGRFNNLLQTIYKLFILWNYLSPDLKKDVYARIPTTKSYTELLKLKKKKQTRWSPGEASLSIISVKLGIPYFILERVRSSLNAANKKLLTNELLELIIHNEDTETEKYDENSLQKGFYKQEDNTNKINEIFKKYTNKTLLEILSEIQNFGKPTKSKKKTTKKTNKPTKQIKKKSKKTKKSGSKKKKK